MGRAQELETVERKLRDDSIRLLTLTGAGGSGKTRLAIEAARSLVGLFAGGVYLLPLAPVATVEAVPVALARILGLRESGGSSMADVLPDYVRHAIKAPTLVVLDNFEHLLALSRSSSPSSRRRHISRCVTSRAILVCRGEHNIPCRRWNCQTPIFPLGSGGIPRCSLSAACREARPVLSPSAEQRLGGRRGLSATRRPAARH
jgi:predicted ATPase